MLIPAFTVHLQDKVAKGAAAVGRFDGKQACLACATSGGKIFLHNPHEVAASNDSLVYLNINKQVASVAAGQLDAALARDVLLVGTTTDLQCYDVHANRDVFYNDVTDGVSNVIVDKVTAAHGPLAIAGGNCSVQGYDARGNEVMWSVTGDMVSAMCACDVTGDGLRELLVGSEDFEIRIFKEEDVITEITEAEKVVGLCGMGAQRFAYALSNGTIGVYNGSTRQWRVKSKYCANAVCSFDLDGDGVPELISGWANGRLEVRSDTNGDVKYRDQLAAPVAAMMTADYRGDGVEQVVVVSTEGEVRGYTPMDNSQGSKHAVGKDLKAQEEALTALHQRRQELLHELSGLEANSASASQQRSAGTMQGGIPSGTQVTHALESSIATNTLNLVVSATSDAVIKGVVLYGEQLFDSESYFFCPNEPSASVRIPLHPKKDVQVDVHIKAFVGAKSSKAYHVYELQRTLQRFCMYPAVQPSSVVAPRPCVAFEVNERINRLVMWLQSSFGEAAVPSGAPASVQQGMTVAFIHLRDGEPLFVTCRPAGNTTQMTVATKSMDLAGEIVQDIASFLSLDELQTTADFPEEMERFGEVLARVDELNAVRLKLLAETADNSNIVKTLVVKAEDARMLCDMTNMKNTYRQLRDINRDLIGEHNKRASNQEALLAALREVNQMIQRAAKLRVGAIKTKIVNACRDAIKNNELQTVLKIVRDGAA